MAKKKQIKVTLVRSPIGFQPKHRECVRGLGLKRMHQTVVLEDTETNVSGLPFTNTAAF